MFVYFQFITFAPDKKKRRYEIIHNNLVTEFNIFVTFL